MSDFRKSAVGRDPGSLERCNVVGSKIQTKFQFQELLECADNYYTKDDRSRGITRVGVTGIIIVSRQVNSRQIICIRTS